MTNFEFRNRYWNSISEFRNLISELETLLPTITVQIQGQLVFTIDPLFIMPQRTEIIIPQAQCKSNIRVFCCRSKKLFTYMPRICFTLHCKYGYRRKKWILVFFPTQACLFDEPTSTRQRKMNAANCCFLLTTFSMSYSLLKEKCHAM